MKVAISIWMERVSPVFDTAGELLVLEIDDQRPGKRSQERLGEKSPHERVECLQRLGVETLICGAVSRPLAEMITSAGIQLLPFIAGDVQEVLEAFIRDRLAGSAFAMPGCCAHGRRRGGTCGMNQGKQDMSGGRGGGMGRGGGCGGGGGRGGAGVGRGQGRGRNALSSLPEGKDATCVCSRCGSTQPKERGVPCSEMTCPECGAAMTRDQDYERK